MSIVKNGFPFLIIPSITILMVISLWFLSNLEFNNERKAILPPEKFLDRIAYIGHDRQLYIINPDGSGLTQISNTFKSNFSWPTWSASNKLLAYTESNKNPNKSDSFSSLNIFDIIPKEHETIMSLERDQTVPLADNVIHYPLWAPNEESIAFVANSNGKTTLFISNNNLDQPTKLIQGGPIWISWSSDSEYLLAHANGQHFLVNNDTSNPIINLGLFSNAYNVPPWKPDKHAILLSIQASNNQFKSFEVNLHESSDLQKNEDFITRGSPSYLWSPNGKALAIGTKGRGILWKGKNLSVHNELKIRRELNLNIFEYISISDKIISFFWSPDDTKIAFIAMSEKPGIFSLATLDIENELITHLIDFSPTNDQLTMFQFFDQYAHSHSVWSPDSKSLVLAGNVESEMKIINETSPSTNYIIVVEANTPEAYKLIGTGEFATWSFR
ncbi:MAG: hypothetical protein ACJ0A3_02950 [Dehalococcoidia bacterium]